MQRALTAMPGVGISGAARQWVVPLLVGLLAYIKFCSFASGALSDGDTLTHIVLGQWMLTHHAIPFHDPLSYSAHGELWVPQEWLAELVLAVAYDCLGWGGVVAIAALAAGTSFVLLTRYLAIVLGPRRAAIGAVLAILLTLVHMLARPHVLAWPFLIIWMGEVVRARDAGRAPSLKLLLPVMLVWANLHAGFVAGLGMAGLLAIEAVAEAPKSVRLRVTREWGVFLGLAAACALVSPNGLNQYLLTFKLLSMHFVVTHIVEWQGLNFTTLQPIFIWIAVMTLGGFALNIRLPASRLAMLLLLLYEALSHVRHVELLAFIGPLLIAKPLADQLGRARTAQAGQMPALAAAPRKWAVLGLSALVVFSVVTTAIALDRRGLKPPGQDAPIAAVEAARAAGLTGNVLNAYQFGGYLSFVGIPVFVDGRADLFGEAFLKRFITTGLGFSDGLPELIRDYAVNWAIVAPDSPAATQLALLPEWKRIYHDNQAVVFRREAGTAKHEISEPPIDKFELQRTMP